MKALILAAGFGTRLEQGFNNYGGPYKEQLAEWVKGKPKGLIPIAGRSIIAHQLEQLTEAGINSRDVYIHTNQRFYQQFLDWANKSGIPKENVFNNGVIRNEDRNEQVKDILLAIAKIGYDKPLFLFASDTLVYGKKELLDLLPMIEIYQQEGLSSVVAYYKEKGASNHGVFSVDGRNRVTNFREKPEGIESGLVNASVYLFSPEKLQQMNSLSEQLLKYKNPLQLIWDGFVVVEAERRLDIGTIDDVLIVNQGMI